MGRRPKLATVTPMAKEPAEMEAMPDYPPELEGDALFVRLWGEIAPQLFKREYLAAEYVPLLVGYLMAYRDYLTLTIQIHKDGRIFETTGRHGAQQKASRASVLRDEALAQMIRISALFGLTPLDNQRLANLGSGQGDLFDQVDQIRAKLKSG